MIFPGSHLVARAVDLTQRRKLRQVACVLAVAVCLTLLINVPGARAAGPAGPPAAADRPPILILGGGLGDSKLFVTHWLGDKTKQVASKGSVVLTTSAAPSWWSGDAPDTYVLSGSVGTTTPASETYTVADLVWALDQLAKRHPVGKTVLVCQGASGLMAREYLEDLAADPSLKQSKRADVVGLVTIGTPHLGLSLYDAHTDLNVWTSYAGGAGRTAKDLAPNAAYMKSLNAGTLPSVVKVLTIRGSSAALSSESSDGIATLSEQSPPASVVTGAIETPVDLKARASDVWPLKSTWLPKTKAGGATTAQVNGSEVEKLEVVRSYATMPETQAAVKTFYSTWFAGDTPVTHISSRLVVDVSGSMKDVLGGVTRIAAAQQACNTFADAMTARAEIGNGVPEDIALVAFNTEAQVVAGPSSNVASLKSAVGKLSANGDTDIGKALQVAVNSFDGSPSVARKVILLLSDGETTSGMDNAAILSGPVAAAAKKGIKIQVVGLGQLRDDHKAFLQQIASTTGGSFSQALSAYELGRDFLRARYQSLGTLQLDSEVALKGNKPATISLVQLKKAGRSIEIGLVPDGAVQWKLLRNGAPVPANEVEQKTGSGGALALVVKNPAAGSYALEVQLKSSSGQGRAHAFVVSQADVFRTEGVRAMSSNRAEFLLYIIAVVGLLVVILAVVLSLRRRTKDGEPRRSGESSDLFGQRPDEPGQGE